MSDKNCPDCLIDENAVGQGKRCVVHEIEFLRTSLAAAEKANAELREELRCAVEIRDSWKKSSQEKCAELAAYKSAGPGDEETKKAMGLMDTSYLYGWRVLVALRSAWKQLDEVKKERDDWRTKAQVRKP